MNILTLRKKIKQVNRRLLNLQRYNGKDFSWAGKVLSTKLSQPKLNLITKSNRISIKNLSKFNTNQLEFINNALDNFINSKTSTIKGIKKIIKTTKETIGKNYKNLVDIEDEIFRYFEQIDYNIIFKYIDPSEFTALVDYAKEKNLSKDRYVEMFGKTMKLGNLKILYDNENDNTAKSHLERLIIELEKSYDDLL